MAGFAVFMTVLFYSAIGFVSVAVLSSILYFATRRNAMSSSAGERRARRELAASPLLALLWIVVALLIHVQISNRLAHQDCGFSPDPYVTLPNGYVLGSLNTYDGYFRAPGYKTDVPVAGPGYVRSLVDLHLQNGFFKGTQFDFRTSHIRGFTFNLTTHEFQSFDPDTSPACDAKEPRCMDKWTIANDRAQGGPDSYWKLYRQYRQHWPNAILSLLLVGGETGIALWAWSLWQAVRRHEATP